MNFSKSALLPFSKKRFLLAVSGGIDSVCLAHYFATNRQKFGIEWLGIAHIHHGLRKVTASRDAKFVQQLAYKLNIPFFIRHLNGNALTKYGSIEENARLSRYQALHEIANLPEVNATAICTAHHAGDQAETVLMRIGRGCSIKGLRGIQAIRDDGIFRPFLNWTKENILQYAAENYLPHVEDESNSDTTFARNAMRLQILPAIERTNPGLTQQLSHIAELADKAYTKIICTINAAIEPFCVSPKLWPFPAEISPYVSTLAVHEKIFKILSLQSPNGGAELLRLWLKEKGFDFPSVTNFQNNFATRNANLIFEKSRFLLWFCKEHKENISMPAGFRARKDGDIYIPTNRPAKKLKKALEEFGIPPFARNFIPVRDKADGSVELFHSINL